jgi:hypothetical protein
MLDVHKEKESLTWFEEIQDLWSASISGGGTVVAMKV